MRRPLLTAIGLATSVASAFPHETHAQAADIEAPGIALAAAKTALMYMPKAADGRTKRGLNPTVVRGDVVSPEINGIRMRDSSTNVFIAEQAGLLVRSPSEVCSAAGCDLRDLAAYVSISESRVEDNYVVVSVNILTPNERPSAVYEEPYKFGLQREGNGEWKVRWVDDMRPGLRPSRIWIMTTP